MSRESMPQPQEQVEVSQATYTEAHAVHAETVHGAGCGKCGAECAGHPEDANLLADETFSSLGSDSLNPLGAEANIAPHKHEKAHNYDDHVGCSCHSHEANNFSEELFSNIGKSETQPSNFKSEETHNHHAHKAEASQTITQIESSTTEQNSDPATSKVEAAPSSKTEASPVVESDAEAGDAGGPTTETETTQNSSDSSKAAEKQSRQEVKKTYSETADTAASGQRSTEHDTPPVIKKEQLKDSKIIESIKQPTKKAMVVDKKTAVEHTETVVTKAEATVTDQNEDESVEPPETEVTVQAKEKSLENPKIEVPVQAEPEAVEALETENTQEEAPITSYEEAAVETPAESANEVSTDSEVELSTETEHSQLFESAPEEIFEELFAPTEALVVDDERPIKNFEIATTIEDNENEDREATIAIESAETEEPEFDIEAILAEIDNLQQEAEKPDSANELVNPSAPIEAVQEPVKSIAEVDDFIEQVLDTENEPADSTTEKNGRDNELSAIEYQIEAKAKEVVKLLVSPEAKKITKDTALEIIERFQLSLSEAQLEELLKYLRKGSSQQIHEYITGLLKLKHDEFQKEFLKNPKQTITNQISQKQARLISLLRKFLPRLLLPAAD